MYDNPRAINVPLYQNQISGLEKSYICFAQNGNVAKPKGIGKVHNIAQPIPTKFDIAQKPFQR